MKLKSIISIMSGTLMLLSFFSCFDLEETTYNVIPADSFGKNKSEVNAIIGPVYNTLKRYFPTNYIYLSECSGDMAINPTRRGGDWYDGGQYRDLHMHTWTPETSNIEGCWNAASESISLCNQVFDIINSSQAIESDEKRQALAEIRGIRAFWLYVMMDNWGNIPLSIDFQDMTLPSTKTRQEAFDLIINELDAIKDDLQSAVSSVTYGKFTKGSAYTLLAKMYLNADAWGVKSGVSNNWDEVIKNCDVVMKLGYNLEADYKNCFKTNNESSNEAIFAACYSANDTRDQNNLHYRTLHYKQNIVIGANFSAWNGLCAEEDYARLFDTDDQRLEGSFLMGEQKDPATNEVLITAHDRPLIYTITVTQIPGTEYEASVWGQVNQEDGYRCWKWPVDKSTLGALENDFYIFRYSDIYLMKAEALVRKGSDNAEATRLVNLVRERGYGNASHNYSSVTLEQIALERKLEFAWECYSRQDCIRFGTFQNPRYLKPDTHGQDYKNIFPIPLPVLRTNSNLKQNPGY